MRRRTIAYAIYMLATGVGLLAVGIYMRAWPAVLGGVGVLLFSVLFYWAEKRSQDPRR